VSQSLTRLQAVVLGAVVVLALAIGAFGLVRVGGKQGLWANTAEFTVQLAEPHDIAPGTVVRVRGVDAGRVVAVEYPDQDGPDAAVTVRLAIDARYAGRLYADASAQVYSTGLLGSKVIAVSPGTPAAGPLADGRLAAKEAPDLAAVAAKISGTADEVGQLVRDVRTGNGSLAKLIQDDKLYGELTGLATDSRAMVTKAGGAIEAVEKKTEDVDRFVQDGRATLRSVKQGTDAVQGLPVIRGYVVDAARLLVRPDRRKQDWSYNVADLFEPDTAVLTDDGHGHLSRLAEVLRGVRGGGTEIVVAALADPTVTHRSAEFADELTKKQADVVVQFLKDHKAHKTGWFTSRKATAIGLGRGPHPDPPAMPGIPAYVQVVLFSPP
jgi:hypothetical protein